MTTEAETREMMHTPEDEGKATAGLVAALERAAGALDGIAVIMDAWAVESRRGGWSTHQVSANQQQADNARRYAAEARAALKKAGA